MIIFTKAETKLDKDYTIDDFPEINCEKVVDISRLSEKEKSYAERVASGDPEILTEKKPLVDFDNFRRTICIYLKENSKENVLNAIKILEKREEFYCVSPNYIYSVY